jgi:hypothetical protein
MLHRLVGQRIKEVKMKKYLFLLIMFTLVFADDKIYESIGNINYDGVPIGFVTNDRVIVFGKKNIVVNYHTMRVTGDSLIAWYIVRKVDKDTVYIIDSVGVTTTGKQIIVQDRIINWPTKEHLDTTYDKHTSAVSEINR